MKSIERQYSAITNLILPRGVQWIHRVCGGVLQMQDTTNPKSKVICLKCNEAGALKDTVIESEITPGQITG